MRAKRILGIIIVLLIALVIAVQIPAVQTRIAERVVEELESGLDGMISFGNVKILPNGTLSLEDVLILDSSPYFGRPGGEYHAPADTLASCRKLTASISRRHLFRDKGFFFKRVSVDGIYLHLVNEPGGYGMNLVRIFDLASDGQASPRPTDHVITIDRIRVTDLRFRLSNYDRDSVKSGGDWINWNDLDVRAEEIRGNKFVFDKGVISVIGTIVGLSEKSGYYASSMSGVLENVSGRTTVNGIEIIDPWSEINCDFTMAYDDLAAFSRFLEQVRLEGRIKPSRIHMHSLNYFARGVLPDRYLVEVSTADLNGTIDDLQVDGMRFRIPAEGISGTVSVAVQDVLSPDRAAFDGSIRNLHYNFKGTDLLINAGVEGPGNELAAWADIQSSAGNAEAEATISGLIAGLKSGRSSLLMGVDGRIRTERLDVGRFTGNDEIGPVTMDAYASARLGGRDRLWARVDTLVASEVTLHGKGYGGIRVSGIFSGSVLDGYISIEDPDLQMYARAAGNYDGDSGNKDLRLDAVINHADLKAMNIDTREGVSQLSCRINANVVGVGRDNHLGSLDFNRLILRNDKGGHEIGDINVTAYRTGTLTHGQIKSDILSGRLSGAGDRYDLRLDFADTRELLAFVLPGLYMSGGTSIDLSFDENLDGNAVITSPLIAYNTLAFRDDRITLARKGNTLDAEISYDNRSEGGTNATLAFSGVLDGKNIHVNTRPSFLAFGGHRWDMLPARLSYADGAMIVRGLEVMGRNESLKVDGILSPSQEDTMTVSINSISLETLNDIVAADYGLRGILTGNAKLFGLVGGHPRMISDIICDSLSVGGSESGRVFISSFPDEETDRVGISIRNVYDGRDSFSAQGHYSVNDREFDLRVVMDRFDLGMARPFLASVLDGIDGSISAVANVKGPLSGIRLDVEGGMLEDARVKVAANQVTYTINGPFRMTPGGLFLDGISISDGEDGKGMLSGYVNDIPSQNMNLGLTLAFSDLKALDIPSGEGSLYGLVYASGNATVNGPLENLLVDLYAVTTKYGNVHLPISSQARDNRSSILSFTGRDEEMDPYRRLLLELEAGKKARRNGNVAIHATLNATPDVEAFVNMTGGTDARLNARGNGLITVDLQPSKGLFDFSGSYNLIAGNLEFTIPGIVSRDFEIQNGSSVKFGGDIMDTELDISAKYIAKPSLAPILADSSLVGGSRTVECGINVSDKLRNPQLSFSIDFPDLDPTAKNMVEGALNTEDKVQKQFVSLLVLNSFIPDDNSGIVYNTGGLYGSAVNMLMSQFNSILRKLDIPLDLGLKYNKSTGGGDLFDVAISTQLFNNRVLVNGNLGNRQTLTTATPYGDFFGDLNIEIKLDRSGQFRFNLFSHSADLYSNYLDLLQRNGLGFSFQSEYTDVRKLFRKIRGMQDEIVPPSFVTVTLEDNE